jgi:hypothetical protein
MTANVAPANAHEAVIFVNEGGYEFDLSHELWKLSRDTSLNWSSIRRYCASDLVESFKALLASLATISSADHVFSQYNRFMHFCKWQYELVGQVHQVNAISLANYRAQLGERTA